MVHVDPCETDPDYNVTLTQNMFSGMREALNAAQQMDTETLATPPISPQNDTQNERPQFYVGD